LYRLPVPKNNNFGQILTFGGLLYLTPFTDDEGQIWYSRADLTQSLHLHAKCNLNALILSASIGQNRNFGQILISRGSCTDPLLPMRAKFGALQQTNGVRLRAKFRIDQFILSPSGGKKNPNFAVFWTSAFCGVASWQQCEKVEHGCTMHNYRPSPIQRHQNRFCVPTPSWRNPGA